MSWRVNANDFRGQKKRAQRALDDYAEQGLVCTVMDKASNTLVWQCAHVYCRKLRDDLNSESAGGKVYQLSTEPEQDALHRHALFTTGQSLPAGATSQEFPSMLVPQAAQE